MISKSDFLFDTAETLVGAFSNSGISLVFCGGMAVHMISDHFGRQSPRLWNHKDIDFLIPVSQFSQAIAMFKNLGYVKMFVPYKKARLTENHVRFGSLIDGRKVLVDLYAQNKISTIRITHKNISYLLLSPQKELDNWKDRRKRDGSKPSIDLSIEFLDQVVNKEVFEENEIQ